MPAPLLEVLCNMTFLALFFVFLVVAVGATPGATFEPYETS